jgi:flagellar biosynthesis protein FlhA
VLTLDPSLEQKIVESKAPTSSGEFVSALEPSLHNAWIRALGKALKAVRDKGFSQVILCSYQARYLVKSAFDREFPEVAVLSISEIAQDYTVQSIGVIRLEQE